MTSTISNSLLIARQPILDVNLKLYAYELLFRDSKNNESGVTIDSADLATTKVISHAFTEFGIENLVGEHLAFINLTRTFLTGELPLPFSTKGVVLEVLEDIVIDDKIVASVTDLAKQGFTIALDDFIYSEEWQPLIDIAAIVKIDLMALSREELVEHVTILKQSNAKLLAEKVETFEEFEFCKSLGFDYFQGYFFSKPTVLNDQALPTSNINLMQVLAELQNPDNDIDELAELIARDAGLSFKLLRILNSAAVALPRQVDSLRQGLVFLGQNTIKKWATLLAVANSNHSNSEVLISAIVRAKMSEQLSEQFQTHKESAFIVGLFSLLDAMTSKPMASLINTIPLSDDIKQALISREGKLGTQLDFISQYEQSSDIEIPPHISIQEVNQAYINATQWAFEIQSELS